MGLHQKVEYEALPTISFTCGKYGHTKELCVVEQPGLLSEKEQISDIPVKRATEEDGATYRLWMVVENKNRCKSRNINSSKENLRDQGKSSSSFDALTNIKNLNLNVGTKKGIEGQAVDVGKVTEQIRD